MTSTPRPAALVTGGGAGIGAAVVDGLLQRGYAVTAVDVAFDSDEPRPDLVRVEADVRDEQRCRRIVDDIQGELQVLVIAAAVRPEAALLEQDVASFRNAAEVNVLGAFTVMQAAACVMPAGGSIVSVSSAAAYGKANVAAYGATKAALISLTTTAALELAERGIRANTVLPGTTDTAMLAGAAVGKSPDGGRRPRNTTGTVLTTTQVAEAIVRVALDPLISGAAVPIGLLPSQW